MYIIVTNLNFNMLNHTHIPARCTLTTGSDSVCVCRPLFIYQSGKLLAMGCGEWEKGVMGQPNR